MINDTQIERLVNALEHLVLLLELLAKQQQAHLELQFGEVPAKQATDRIKREYGS